MGSGTKSINRMKRCMFLYEILSGQEKWFKFQIGSDVGIVIININRTNLFYLYATLSGQEKQFKFQIGRDIEFFIININRTNLFYMQAFLDRKIGSNFKLEETQVCGLIFLSQVKEIHNDKEKRIKEMGGIGSGTKSIKRLRRGKICDYEHQKNKSITFFSSKKGKQIKKKEK